MTVKLQVKVTILCIGLLLVFIFYQVYNNYKINPKVLSDLLTEIEVSSTSLAAIRQSDTEKSRYSYEDMRKSQDIFNYVVSDYFIADGLKSQPETINLAVNFSKNIEDITLYDIKKSESEVFYLLDRLYDDYQDKKYLLKSIALLKVKALKEKSNNLKTEYKETLSYAINIRNEYIRKDIIFDKDIGYLINHLTFIARSQSIINYRVSQQLSQYGDMQDGVYKVEKYIISSLKKERARIFILSVLLVLSVLSVSLIVLFVVNIFIASYKICREYKLTINTKKYKAIPNQAIKNNKINVEGEDKKTENLFKSLVSIQKRMITLINNIEGCVYEYDLNAKKVTFVSSGLEKIWGLTRDQVLGGDKLRNSIHVEDRQQYYYNLEKAVNANRTANIEYRISNNNGELVWVREIATPLISKGESNKLASICYDVTAFKKAGLEKEKMKTELVQAQKLESVGQLAAGIAHEINTPSQFISDNLTFLQESVGEILELIKVVNERIDKEKRNDLTADLKTLINAVDMSYLAKEIPSALLQSYEGIMSVSKIVRAMKDYAHPEQSFKLVNINMSVESTIIVSSSEWKYSSKIKRIFDDSLPMVECVAGDINQVVLNIIINAAHSIAEKYNESNEISGEIIVQTKKINNNVSIEIADNGNGMTEDTRNKVFDHFFTTKEVGKGTGQGLSIAHRLIVEKHQGVIEVESTLGEGSIFRIIVPVKHKAINYRKNLVN